MAQLNPYAEPHRNPQGPGDARPTAAQVVQDQNLDWTGKVVLITGCSPGGLGPETAKAIHLTRADVFITSRSASKGREIADEILTDGRPGKVEVVEMELGSFSSIRTGAEDFSSKAGGKLNVLITNAGSSCNTEPSTLSLTHCRTHVRSGRQDWRWLRNAYRHKPSRHVSALTTLLAPRRLTVARPLLPLSFTEGSAHQLSNSRLQLTRRICLFRCSPLRQDQP